MSAMNTKESGRSKRDRDTLSMYNSKQTIQIFKDLRKSANVRQRNMAKSKDFSVEKLGPDVLASKTIATDNDDLDSSAILHHVEQRKYTLERAK